MKERFMRWMRGRYGRNDSLNNLLLGIALVFLFLSFFFHQGFGLISIFLLALTYYRMFSRNIYQRAAENQAVQRRMAKVKSFFRRQKSSQTQQDRTYRFFTCKTCKQKMRVPKGKGKIEIHCRKCGATFIAKT
ncbi:MAG: hypothetical protein LBM69_06265 [Lachnospiraceae bacterium]|jgi:hypothetical protein|nr:hypothetical protein [Lachnospiraceae bacterium]